MLPQASLKVCCDVSQICGFVDVSTCFLASLQAKDLHQGCSPSVLWAYAPRRPTLCGKGPTAPAPRTSGRLPASLICCYTSAMGWHWGTCLGTWHCVASIPRGSGLLHTAVWPPVQLCVSLQSLSHSRRPLVSACVACQCTKNCSIGHAVPTALLCAPALHCLSQPGPQVEGHSRCCQHTTGHCASYCITVCCCSAPWTPSSCLPSLQQQAACSQ